MRLLARPELGAFMDEPRSMLPDLTAWDRLLRTLPAAGTGLSGNALAAPTGTAVASSALLTTSAGGVAPVFAGTWGAKDLIRDPYSDATSGGLRLTALTAEVLHLRIGCDPAAPYYGTAPLKRAQLTAGPLKAVESALVEAFENAPIGSQIVPLPDSAPDDMDNMRAAFRGRRGSVLVIEGVAQATAAGMNPQLGQCREDLPPNLKDAMAIEAMQAARDAIGAAFGVLPGLLNRAATGPMVREAQHRLATWQLQPLAELLAEEASQKPGAAVRIDTLRPLQAFDAGGRARALSAIIGAMAQAKQAGIDPDLALKLVDWHEREAP